MFTERLIKDISEKYITSHNVKLSLEELNPNDISNENFEDYLHFIVYNILNYIFFNKGIVVTIINSEPVFLKEEILKSISKLIKSNTNRDITSGFLHEFIALYYLSFESDLYKSNQHYPLAKKLLEDEFENKDIYHNFKNIILDYYHELFTNINFKIDSQFIYRFFKIYCHFKLKEEKLDLIFAIIEKQKYLRLIYELLPKNLKTNSDIIEFYNVHFKNTSDEINEDKTKLLATFYSRKQLDKNVLASYINSIIRNINDIYQNYEISPIIQLIYDIDELIKNLNKLNSLKFEADDLKIKEKIKECIRYLLYLKRKLLEDDHRLKREMKSLSFKGEIESEIIDAIEKEIHENPFNIYKHLYIDFHEAMKNAIIACSKHPILFHINQVTIDSEKRIYFFDNYDSEFSDYFENIGRQIEEDLIKNKEIKNHTNSCFYNLLIKHLNSFSKRANEAFLLSIINFDVFYDNLKKMLGDELFDDIYRNRFIFIAELVFQIEYELLEIYNTVTSSNKTTMDRKYLWALFENCEDKKIKNNILYLYYNLYLKDGFNIRNNLFHGNIIFDDSKPYVLRVASCFVALTRIMRYYHVRQ